MSERRPGLGTPTPYGRAIEVAGSIVIPEHVRRAYRWTPLRDVFFDGRKLWHAETHALRSALPPDPENHPKVPPQFWDVRLRRQHFRAEHEAVKWGQDAERLDAEQPAPAAPQQLQLVE